MAYNILVVDDSSIVRKALRKTIGLSNVDVGEWLEAENGEVALGVMEHKWVDIVFLDINMPVMNGIEFMKRLRANTTYGQTPVVVVSTEGSKERIEELQSMGIRSYLRKPVTPEAVVDVVTDLLGGEKK